PHVSSGVRSAGCNLIATRVFGMSETIAITGKSVKLFKGHYTRTLRRLRQWAMAKRTWVSTVLTEIPSAAAISA
ncbi:MAG: hypothetical protein ACREYE_33495, partial [Gammaproteobacteria bacterium]